MSVRRKSNWYIYLIAFGVAMAFAVMVIFTFRWYLFPEKAEEVGLTSAGELSDSFRPTAEHNFVLLAMLSDDAADAPELFVMTAYNAVESRVTFIPVPEGISIPADGRTLPNVYSAQGGEGVISSLETAVGVKCDAFVKLDRTSFSDFVTAVGNVEYDVPKTVIITDGIEGTTINAGSQLFTGDNCYQYIALTDFEEGEGYRFNIVGGVLSELINQNFMGVDSSLLDTFTQFLMNAPETNITAELYNSRKAALLNTIAYGTSPAEYYVPYGEYTDDGGFAVSENSITTIRQKAGIE